MSANKDNDVNITSLTGTVVHVEKVLTVEGFLLEVDVSIRKQAKFGPKLSSIKVVLFDDLAIAHEPDLFEGQRVFVNGELDETAFVKGGLKRREIRIVGRFVKTLGQAVAL